MAPREVSFEIQVGSSRSVAALLAVPDGARTAFVFAHGAGAGMTHPFMATFANGLGAHGIATLRFEFPYMQSGSRRPDAPRVAQATVRAAVVEASRRLPDCALFAGGKSFGGRMTSQAQADDPLPAVRGLVFVGFPLHPAGKPSLERAAHLAKVSCPMLFLQGTRDTLADLDLIKQVTRDLGQRATLEVFEGADHSFHVPARSGISDAEVLHLMTTKMAAWMSSLLATE
jgi:predicted alpha/beta-hydrolase family hydrolase